MEGLVGNGWMDGWISRIIEQLLPLVLFTARPLRDQRAKVPEISQSHRFDPWLLLGRQLLQLETGLEANLGDLADIIPIPLGWSDSFFSGSRIYNFIIIVFLGRVRFLIKTIPAREERSSS